MKHYMKNKPNKTVLKPSAWLCIHALGVFACLTWLRSYMLLCLCACELSMLVSLCTLRACVLACLPCLLCLTVLRVYILAWCAHLSCLLYIAISKFKNVFISKNLFVLLHWIFFCMQQFDFYIYQFEALHFEISLKEAVRSITLK